MDKMKKVNICLICDDGYVMPTSVAMTSMIESKNKDTIYNFYIVCASLSYESEQIFESMNSDTVFVNIIRQDASRFADLHTFKDGAFCVATPAALLKFILPEVIPCEKVLYLDGDLLVKEDLVDLFETDITDKYLAAVVDSGTIYVKNEYISSVQDYFNSGVMLLNLELMREENLSEVLIDTKMKQQDSNLMDQNIFNCVCDKRIVTLPIRYNFLPVNLVRAYGKWTLQEINERYGTSYKDEGSLFSDAAIIHFSSKDKPWKNDTVSFADEWYRCYLKAPIEHTLKRSNASTTEDVSPKISVIIPIYNVEDYIEETIDCILNQTLQDIEVLAIDDGSTDNSLEKLYEIAKKDSRVKVYHQENQGQGVARNFGIKNAKGKYIYFMDSDDIIDPETLKTCYETAQWNNADLVLFEGMSFFDEGMKFDQVLWDKYKALYHRKKFYSRVYSGEDLYCMLSSSWDFIISPCMKLYSRKYILDNEVFFPENIKLEDNFFAVKSILEANRVKVLNNCFYKRRLRDNSTMTSSSNEYKKFVGYHETACKLLEYIGTRPFKENTLRTAAFHAYQWFNNAYEVYNTKLTENEKNLTITDHNVTKITFPLLSPIFMLYKKDFFSFYVSSSTVTANWRDVRKYRDESEKYRLERDKYKQLMEAYMKGSEEGKKELDKIYHAVSVSSNDASKYKKQLDDVHNSVSFKIGRAVTWLPRKIRGGIKCYRDNGFVYTFKRLFVKIANKIK